MEAREGKGVVTLEIDFGGRINRSWRRMECGYPGLGTGQIIRKLCDQSKSKMHHITRKLDQVFPSYSKILLKKKKNIE